MLQKILDSCESTEFWYVDQGVLAPEADISSTFRKLQRQEEKWWLPVPRVPTNGLSEIARKQLQHQRDCTNQILKASVAINSVTLADMEIPDMYFKGLPKVKLAQGINTRYQDMLVNMFPFDFVAECKSLLGRSYISIYCI